MLIIETSDGIAKFMNSFQLDVNDVGVLHRNIVGINKYAYIKEYILYIFLNEMLMNIFYWTYPVKSSLINLTAPEWKDLGEFFFFFLIKISQFLS